MRVLTLAVIALLSTFSLRAAETAPPEPSLAELRQEGRTAFEERRYFRSIEAFRKALDLAEGEDGEEVRRNLASAYGALGAEYFNGGENRLAQETFRKGLEFSDNYFSHFGLGYLYFLRMEDAKALEHLRTAADLNPVFAGTHKLLGLLDYRKGSTREAIRHLEKARELDPEDEETRALLSRWRTESGFLAKFAKHSTAHFSFRSDPAVSAVKRRRLAGELESAYDEIGNRLGTWPSEKIAVVLFSEKSFHDATGARHWVGGMYDGQLKLPVPEDYLSTPDLVAKMREVIRHEYTHAVVRHMAPECPVWLNEGIAQHFEGQVDREKLGKLLADGRARKVPFRELPSQLWAVDDLELARWSYLQGLGLIEYLVEHHGEFRLRLLLAALAEEHSVGKAVERTYGRSLEELEREWWSEVEERAVTRSSEGRAAGAAGRTPDVAPSTGG